MKKQARFFFVLLITISVLFYSLIVMQAKGLAYEVTFEEKFHLESTGGDTFMCEVYDDLAIIIDMDGGLLTYNVSNPSAPVHLDTFYDGGIPHDFFVEDDLLYLADHHQGLEIYNISNPSNLVKLGQIADVGDGETDGVFVCDNIAYTAEWHDSTWDWSMVLINVTNPNTPVLISEYVDGDNEFHRFYVENEICYASCLTSGFKILNVTNPLSIGEIGAFNNGGYNYDLIIQDNIALVTSGELEILNLTDLSNPTLVNSYSTVNSIFDIEIEDDLAFVTVFQNGVEVVNVSSFDNLEKIGDYNANFANNLVATSNLLYVSMHGDGIKILEYQLSDVTETANMIGISILFTSLATISLIVLIIQKKNKYLMRY